MVDHTRLLDLVALDQGFQIDMTREGFLNQQLQQMMEIDKSASLLAYHFYRFHEEPETKQKKR